MKRQITILFIALTFVLGLALWPQQSSVNAKAVPPMAGFTVNTTADAADATPGDGVCADANGNCSLRAAIGEANALAGDETITFNLPAGPNTINLTGALPNITSSLTITGPGAKLLTVRRDTGGNYCIFNIQAFDLNITISGNTANGGGYGGGILNQATIPGLNGQGTMEAVTIAPTVVLKVNCKILNANGSYTVRFGYENTTGGVVTIPVGANNMFTSGAANRGQATAFQPGVVNNAFSVTFANAGAFTGWSLRGPDGGLRGVVPSVLTPNCP